MELFAIIGLAVLVFGGAAYGEVSENGDGRLLLRGLGIYAAIYVAVFGTLFAEQLLT
jgi:hypothetical protein